MPSRAVFLDRDGIINQLVLNPATGEYESPHALSEIEILPGVAAAAKRLIDAGFTLFTVSNQPSAAKGKVSLERLLENEAFIEARLSEAGAPITRGYYCHHHPEGIVAEMSGPCGCRKPAPGSLLAARDTFDIDLSRSWMIGDQDTDVLCGQNAGCRTILVAHPLSTKRRVGRATPTLHANDLPDAVEQLLKTVAAEGAR
jgi:D-glycero-D-manno-heptose 1,7-bisphosphate phosphatase